MPDDQQADERLRAALRDLRDSAAPHVRAPGVAQAERAVRRRSAVRQASLLGVTCLLTLVVVLQFTPAQAPPLTPSSPSPTLPAPSTSAAPSATATGGSAPAGAMASPLTCAALTVIDKISNGKTVRVRATLRSTDDDPPCQATRIKLTYVSYQIEADGSQSVYTTKIFYLTPEKLDLTFAEDRPDTCYGESVTLVGDVAVLPTLPRGAEAYFSYPRDDGTGVGVVTSTLPDYDCLNTLAPQVPDQTSSPPPPTATPTTATPSAAAQ